MIQTTCSSCQTYYLKLKDTMMETRLLIPDRGVAGEADSQQRCQSSLLLLQQEVRLDHLGQSGGRSGG